jgi:hypothetical protein
VLYDVLPGKMSPLQWLLDAFGTSAFGKIVASTIIGAFLFFFFTLRAGGQEVGSIWQWTIAGGGFGFVAGSILAGQRAFFGSLLSIIGFLLITVPITTTDGSHQLVDYIIKISIGVGFLLPGILLLRKAMLRRRLDRQRDADEAAVNVETNKLAEQDVVGER